MGSSLTLEDFGQIHALTAPCQTLSDEASAALLDSIRRQTTETTLNLLLQYRIPNELVVRILTYIVEAHQDLQYDPEHENELFEAIFGTSSSAKAFYPAMKEACLHSMRCSMPAPSGTTAELTSELPLNKIRHLSLVFPITRRGRHWTDDMPYTSVLHQIKSSMPQLRTLACYLPLRRTALSTPPGDDSMQPWIDGVVSLVKDMQSIMPTVSLGMKFQGYCWEEGPDVFQVIRQKFYSDDDPFENGWGLIMLAPTPYGAVEEAEGETAADLTALLASKHVEHERQLRGTVKPSLYP